MNKLPLYGGGNVTPRKLNSILMMSCRSPFLDDSKVYPPLAALYLKSFINKHAPHVTVGLGDDNYNLDERLTAIEPYDAVGLSIMTPQRSEAYKLARKIREEFPNKVIIAGGPHVKHYFDEVVANKDFDYVVPLDGEKALTEIVWGDAPNRVVSSVMSKRDILQQPRPDRTSLEAISLLSRYRYVLGGRESTTMLTARGCPEQCTFCEDAQTGVKWSSYKNLEAELDDIQALDFGGVYLFDDLFAIALKKIQPILDGLKKRDLIFRCNGQVRYFTKWGDDFARALGDAGCHEMAFGFESGHQKILDNIKKRTTVDMNYKAVEYAQQHGIKVKAFMMLGLPGEDAETVAATEKFIATSGIDDFQLAVYYPYKGTQIRDAIDRGESGFDLEFEGEGLGAYGQKGGSSEAVVRTKAYTSKDLLQIRDELVRKYKPQSHSQKWDEDKFFDTAHEGDLSA